MKKKKKPEEKEYKLFFETLHFIQPKSKLMKILNEQILPLLDISEDDDIKIKIEKYSKPLPSEGFVGGLLGSERKPFFPLTRGIFGHSPRRRSHTAIRREQRRRRQRDYDKTEERLSQGISNLLKQQKVVQNKLKKQKAKLKKKSRSKRK